MPKRHITRWGPEAGVPRTARRYAEGMRLQVDRKVDSIEGDVVIRSEEIKDVFNLF